ncbi:MAG: hypothetical protein RBS55_10710 [Bacteroidales bacterium]|jgi:hypothetical protein|nr:hypothetical protein [Bacteroidales bacterium]
MCQTSNLANDPYVTGIIGSVIAGFLTLGIIHLFNYLKRECWKYKLKAIFGQQDKFPMKMNLHVFRIRKDVTTFLQTYNFPNADFPLLKSDGTHVRSEKLIGNCDTKALKYLSDLLANKMNSKPELIIDEDLSKKLDLSFIAFGGSNFYCNHILSEIKNPFYDSDNKSITNKQNKNSFTINNDVDFGLIIKYIPPSFPEKIWIIIYGIGETGTSGAAWYLSTHWREFYKEFKNQEFGVVIKVKHGVDESAEIVDKARK